MNAAPELEDQTKVKVKMTARQRHHQLCSPVSQAHHPSYSTSVAVLCDLNEAATSSVAAAESPSQELAALACGRARLLTKQSVSLLALYFLCLKTGMSTPCTYYV